MLNKMIENQTKRLSEERVSSSKCKDSKGGRWKEFQVSSSKGKENMGGQWKEFQVSGLNLLRKQYFLPQRHQYTKFHQVRLLNISRIVDRKSH